MAGSQHGLLPPRREKLSLRKDKEIRLDELTVKAFIRGGEKEMETGVYALTNPHAPLISTLEVGTGVWHLYGIYKRNPHPNLSRVPMIGGTGGGKGVQKKSE